jgi:DNA polymerase III alpha subunit
MRSGRRRVGRHQFDKDDVEAAGLVKFDFLGLRTLTILDEAVRLAKAVEGAADRPRHAAAG